MILTQCLHKAESPIVTLIARSRRETLSKVYLTLLQLLLSTNAHADGVRTHETMASISILIDTLAEGVLGIVVERQYRLR